MVTSIDSQFDPIYFNDTYLLATLLDPKFTVKFFETATTQSAIYRPLQQACESYSDILPMEINRMKSFNQMMTIRETQVKQVGHVIHHLVILNLIPLVVLLQNLQVTQRKGDLVCMILIKKLFKNL